MGKPLINIANIELQRSPRLCGKRRGSGALRRAHRRDRPVDRRAKWAITSPPCLPASARSRRTVTA